MKKTLISILVLPFILASCAGGGLSASNKKVCADISTMMEGSGYMEGSRDSLLKATISLAFYEPDATEDWVTYVSPKDGSYRPSLNDNDNAVYQNLYRLQEQAINYIDSKNSGLFYNEWRYFQEGCGITE
jgi:hypothetical protein